MSEPPARAPRPRAPAPPQAPLVVKGGPPMQQQQQQQLTQIQTTTMARAPIVSNVQFVNVRAPAPAPAPATVANKSVAAVSPRVVIGSPQLVAARPPGPGLTLQALQGFPGAQQGGHLLLKTESGQYQLLRVGPPNAVAQQVGPAANAPQQIRIATVPVQQAQAQNGQPPKQQQPQQQPQQQQPQQQQQQQQQQKTAADGLKEKCRKFLSNLLDLSSKEPKSVERNVRALIQELIDGRVEPDAFCARLEKLLNASPQPCLIGFLKKTLPILRRSLADGEIVIDGVRPPPPSALVAVPAPTTVSAATTTTSVATPLRAAAPTPPRPPPPRAPPKPGGAAASASRPPAKPTPRDRKSAAAAASATAPSAASYDADKGGGGDDDINDVAAMGGVNLAEETRRLAGATADAIGAQVRSCKDEYLCQMGPLQARLRRIAAEHGLDEPGFDVAALVSHAVHERLKNAAEKLSCVAEHRADALKADANHERSRDVKGELRFLEELDRVERKKREDAERETLLRAAKSRSKTEDPEQAKLKEKAKEMQRAEMEEMRQREANLTALQAIGPRKRPRTGAGPEDGAAPSSAAAAGAEAAPAASRNGLSRAATTAAATAPPPPRARTKRVNFRDLLFVLEQEKETARSAFLYKCYLK